MRSHSGRFNFHDRARLAGWTMPAKIAAILVLGVFSSLAFAQFASSQPDLKSRFLEEAPAEWKKLQSAVGNWEVRDEVTILKFPATAGGSTTKPVVEQHSAAHLLFNSSLEGMRFETNPISNSERPVDPRTTTVEGSNKDYDFIVDRNLSGPFRISKYEPIQEAQHDDHWLDILDSGLELVSQDIDEYNVSKIIQGIGGEVKSATPTQINGNTFVRLDFDRKFPNSQKPYPGWVLMNPDFHWAVISYEQQCPTHVDRGSVDYWPNLDVAFPRHYVEEQYDMIGALRVKRSFEFQAPRESQATVDEFTLESFGLEKPKSGVRQTPTSNSISVQPQSGEPQSTAPLAMPDATGLMEHSVAIAVVTGVFGIAFYVLYLWKRKKSSAR